MGRQWLDGTDEPMEDTQSLMQDELHITTDACGFLCLADLVLEVEPVAVDAQPAAKCAKMRDGAALLELLHDELQVVLLVAKHDDPGVVDVAGGRAAVGGGSGRRLRRLLRRCMDARQSLATGPRCTEQSPDTTLIRPLAMRLHPNRPSTSIYLQPPMPHRQQ
jgi:hypothetical protein